MLARQVGPIAVASRGIECLNAVALAAASWLRRAGCGVNGHEMVRHFHRHRVSLECMRCGLETPGWTIYDARGAVSAAHVGSRRVAVSHHASSVA